MKKYTKNWKEKAARKENLMTEVIFDMGFKRGNSQAENRGQIEEERAVWTKAKKGKVHYGFVG